MAATKKPAAKKTAKTAAKTGAKKVSGGATKKTLTAVGCCSTVGNSVRR